MHYILLFLFRIHFRIAFKNLLNFYLLLNETILKLEGKKSKIPIMLINFVLRNSINIFRENNFSKINKKQTKIQKKLL